jgi:hypothetical protein
MFDLEEDTKDPNKAKMRNLRQYNGLSDEEFDELYAKKMVGITANKETEKLIQKKLDAFAVDYDLDDLNSNDKMALRALAQAFVSLEIYESESSLIRSAGIDVTNIELLEKINKMISNIRSDISRMSEDLSISRKVRKPTKETSAIDYIEGLKRKAKEFYESKMAYVYCPKCDMLLGTFWTLYPDDERNKITLVCNRIMESGEKCNNKVVISTKELLENKQSNNQNTPESLR